MTHEEPPIIQNLHFSTTLRVSFVSNKEISNTKNLLMSKVLATLLTLACMFCLLSTATAQPYDRSLGIRVGSANGISYQQFFGRSNSGMETLFVYRRGGARVIGMFTHHIPIGGRSSDTYFYFGIGGHVGMNGFFFEEKHNKSVAGVDAMAGFMYDFYHSPFSVSIDIKPMVELWGTRTLSGNNAGFTLRYALD